MIVIYKTVLLLLMFVVSVNAGSISSKKRDYVAVQKKMACAKSEKEAIIKVDTILEKIIGIPSKHLYSKNIYIRHHKNSKGAFCVEGIVTKAGFSLYDAQLQEEYEMIMGEVEDLNDGISYVKKQAQVERLYREVMNYNKRVDAAKKLAPLVAQKIHETKTSLSKMINATPVVTFKVHGCHGTYRTDCKLVFISSFEDESSSVVYRWNFGDGSQSRRTNPIHRYKRPGKYKVSLRITDSGKKYSDVTNILTVRAKPKPKIRHKPTASFSTNKKVYVKNEPIAFINLSSSVKSKVIAYEWNFGDKSNSKVCNPKHSFSRSGGYKVHLTITNDDGLKSSSDTLIQVVHPAIKFAIDGRKLNRIIRKFGQPERSIVKTGVLTQAYKYGNDWLLVKQNKVGCRINGNAFKLNLMGNPKNCHWYEKHAPSAMYIF